MTEDKNTQVHEEPQVMSETDVHDFQGLTLNENGQEERSQEQMDWDDAAKQEGIHVIHIHSLPLWKKILYGTAFIGFLMLLAVAVCLCRIWGNTGCSGSGLCGFQTVSINR